MVVLELMKLLELMERCVNIGKVPIQPHPVQDLTGYVDLLQVSLVRKVRVRLLLGCFRYRVLISCEELRSSGCGDVAAVFYLHIKQL